MYVAASDKRSVMLGSKQDLDPGLLGLRCACELPTLGTFSLQKQCHAMLSVQLDTDVEGLTSQVH